MSDATTGRKAFADVEIKGDKGEVTALFSRFAVKDFDDDWTLPEAFEDGAAVKISAWNHESWFAELPVGRGKIRVTSEGATLEGKFFLSTMRGKEHFEVVKALGELQEWSYGYKVLETGELTEEMERLGVRRVLKKLRVTEVSPVIQGAGVETRTLSVKRLDALPPDVEVVTLCADCNELVKEYREAEAASKSDAAASARKEFWRFQRTLSGLYVHEA